MFSLAVAVMTVFSDPKSKRASVPFEYDFKAGGSCTRTKTNVCSIGKKLTLLWSSCRSDVVPIASSKMDSATTSGSNCSHAEHPCVTDSNTRELAFSWHAAVMN